MKTVWQRPEKAKTMEPEVWHFLAGRDTSLDTIFLPYDIAATMAQAGVLARAGIITSREERQIRSILSDMLKKTASGKLKVSLEDEDCHSLIELTLTNSLGDIGKKIQTGRSRNEQAVTMVRLYMKDKAGQLTTLAAGIQKILRSLGGKHQGLQMPGYTHSQKAMPVSVKVFFDSYADSLADDLKLLRHIISIIDQSPAGSAAGFGLPFPWPSELATRELKFSKTQKNPIYCQASRIKFERMYIFGLEMLTATISRLASDLVLFTMQEFGFFSLPDQYTTGSSLMPNKRNYDVFELARAARASVSATGIEAGLYGHNMISGYHRDYQRSKEAVVRATEDMVSLLSALSLVLPHLQVHKDVISSAVTAPMQATAKALEMARQGIPFRDAYQKIKTNLN